MPPYLLPELDPNEWAHVVGEGGGGEEEVDAVVVAGFVQGGAAEECGLIELGDRIMKVSDVALDDAADARVQRSLDPTSLVRLRHDM